MQYTEKVIQHFTNPQNVGEIENADGVGEVGNAKCGDIMKMYLKIDNDVTVSGIDQPVWPVNLRLAVFRNHHVFFVNNNLIFGEVFRIILVFNDA